MGISLILFSSSSRSAAAPPIHLSHHQTYPPEPKPPGLDKHKITLVTNERPSSNDRKKHGTPSWVTIKLITTPNLLLWLLGFSFAKFFRKEISEWAKQAYLWELQSYQGPKMYQPHCQWPFGQKQDLHTALLHQCRQLDVQQANQMMLHPHRCPPAETNNKHYCLCWILSVRLTRAMLPFSIRPLDK